MRATSRVVFLLFGLVFAAVTAVIAGVFIRAANTAMDATTRTTGSSAMVSTLHDTLIWTVAPIVLVTIAALAMVFFVMRRILGFNPGLLARGIPGTALVRDVRDTGITINRVNAVFEVLLKVTIPDQEPYEARTRLMLGRMSWGVLQPGMTVAVKVDPRNRARVAIDLGQSAVPMARAGSVATAGGSFPLPGVVGAMQANAVRDAADVIATGQRAEGTIQSVSATGATAGQIVPDIEPEKADDPMVFVAMQVRPRKGAAFAAQGIYRVPKHKLGALALGRRVPVSYLPGQPQSATIDWSRM